ncbi:MAG: hypothetical protein R2681_16440 [Pyrinomonadaceae bacterium]
MRIFSYFIVFIMLTGSVCSQTTRDWKISDYLQNLPKQYKTYEGDIPEPTDEYTFIDVRNGYAAYLMSPNGNPDEYFFEMAMFKPKKGEPTLVVSNYKYDFVCFDYDTFFLQKQGSKWVDVKSDVLPVLTEKMFFADSEAYDYYVKQKEKFGDKVSGLVMHFYPPRSGTVMNVNLELCDYVDDSIVESDANNYRTITDALKTISLSWNKETGKFEVIPEED